MGSGVGGAVLHLYRWERGAPRRLVHRRTVDRRADRARPQPRAGDRHVAARRGRTKGSGTTRSSSPALGETQLGESGSARLAAYGNQRRRRRRWRYSGSVQPTVATRRRLASTASSTSRYRGSRSSVEKYGRWPAPARPRLTAQRLEVKVANLVHASRREPGSGLSAGARRCDLTASAAARDATSPWAVDAPNSRCRRVRAPGRLSTSDSTAAMSLSRRASPWCRPPTSIIRSCPPAAVQGQRTDMHHQCPTGIACTTRRLPSKRDRLEARGALGRGATDPSKEEPSAALNCRLKRTSLRADRGTVNSKRRRNLMDAAGAELIRQRIEQHEHWRQAQAVRDGSQSAVDPDRDQLLELGDVHAGLRAAGAARDRRGRDALTTYRVLKRVVRRALGARADHRERAEGGRAGNRSTTTRYVDRAGADVLRKRIEEQEHWAQAPAVRDGHQARFDPDRDELRSSVPVSAVRQ